MDKIALRVELANPLGVFDVETFTYLYEDEEFKRIASSSSIYTILQRPCLVFSKLSLIKNSEALEGVIIQPYSGYKISFKIDLYQNDVIEGSKRDLVFLLHENKFLDLNKKNLDPESLNLDQFTIKETDFNGGHHLKLITPDTIIERYYSKMWDIQIIGNIQLLLNFEVKYIGHSVKQFIGNRLRSHSNLQRIISRSIPIQKGMHIAKELCIAIWEIRDIYDMRIINDLSDDEKIKYIRGELTPSDSKIYYDFEKALIRYFDTPLLENVDRYPNYPKSIDGLFDENINIISYAIKDPYRLFSKDKEIKFGLNRQSLNVYRNEKIVKIS